MQYPSNMIVLYVSKYNSITKANNWYIRLSLYIKCSCGILFTNRLSGLWWDCVYIWFSYNSYYESGIG